MPTSLLEAAWKVLASASCSRFLSLSAQHYMAEQLNARGMETLQYVCWLHSLPPSSQELQQAGLACCRDR